tara:strand:+ start:2337 stop:5315 length:2979 start_codon:yes stop_codon:yes gene_type:complete
MITSLKNALLKCMHFNARVDIFFILLLWLMLLLTAGTIAQKDIGLYAAQNKYFSSFFIYIGEILPLPGGYLVMGLIFTGLLSKTLLEKWKKENIGTLITHISILMLLLGGFITALFSHEGNMVIEEGSQRQYISDYHSVELAIIEQSATNSETETTIAFDESWLKDNETLTHIELPFSIKIKNFYLNALVEKYKLPLTSPHKHISANSYKLTQQETLKESEMNQSAAHIIIDVNGLDIDYVVFEDMPLKPVVQHAGKTYRLELRHKRSYLPFSIELVNFKVDRYASSTKAQSYSSEVILKDGDMAWRSVISMNEPLRYKGYTLFQSSFIEGSRDTTVLAVVNNIGRLFPYISSSILCLGLLIHLFIRLPKLIRKYAFHTFLILSFVTPFAHTNAQEINLQTFSAIPVIENGRIKPIDTFARHQLTAFNGKDSIDGMSASAWLAETLFDHQTAYQRPFFNISNPQIVSALELPKREKHRYSFQEIINATKTHLDTIRPIEKIAENDRSLEQKQLLEIYYNAASYYEISRSFSFVLPLFFITNQNNAQRFDFPVNSNISYLDIRPKKEEILETIISPPSTLAPIGIKELEHIYQRIEQIEKDQQSEVLKLIPAQWGKDNAWYSPWAIFSAGQGSPKTASYIESWQKMAFAYLEKSDDDFQKTSVNTFNKSLTLGMKTVEAYKLKLEVTYNKYKPFKVSLVFYLLSFLTILLTGLIHKKSVRITAYVLLTAGFIIHTLGIIARMVIMARPPVTSLYESVLFVGFIAVLFSLIFEYRKKDRLGIFIGSTLGVFLQFISMRYAAEGETLGMLEAVLNTNFWLATHVVTITIGYGCCLVAGLLGHIYLVARLRNPHIRKPLDILTKNMLGAALIALFFSTIGTILGGIWADQSWGRFWGWDPKENGAMLICMWLIWLLHGRIAGTIRPLYFAAGIAFTNVIVALAWFGVNLLGVGLHSYGFTNNILLNLTLFCTVEFAVIAILTFLNHKKTKGKRSLK